MKAEIETLIMNTLRLDETIKPDLIPLALRILRGEPTDASFNVGKILIRSELAATFRVSTRTISNWARRGRLQCVKDCRGQTIGYTSESAQAIYRGER